MKYAALLLFIFLSCKLSAADIDYLTIEKLINEIDSTNLIEQVKDLSGENEVTIDGKPVRIVSRFYAHPGHDLATKYIYNKLQEYGYSPELIFCGNYHINNSDYSQNDVIAVSKGTLFPEKYIYFTAHYDTMTMADDSIAPGADDNGSGVTTVLEAARILSKYPHNYSIVFALLDGEETTENGSYHLADSLRQNNINDVIDLNMDMMAYFDSTTYETYIFGDTSEANMQYKKIVVSLDSALNLATKLNLEPNKLSGGDDYAFNYFHYPAITFSEIAFDKNGNCPNPNYHSKNDKLPTYNFDYFIRNVRLSFATLCAVAEVTIPNGVDRGENSNQNISDAFPNPANSDISFEFGNNTGIYSLTIFDFLGNNIYKNYYNLAENSNRITINLSNLNLYDGIYFCKLINIFNGTTIIKKFIFKK